MLWKFSIGKETECAVAEACAIIIAVIRKRSWGGMTPALLLLAVLHPRAHPQGNLFLVLWFIQIRNDFTTLQGVFGIANLSENYLVAKRNFFDT